MSMCSLFVLLHGLQRAMQNLLAATHIRLGKIYVRVCVRDKRGGKRGGLSLKALNEKKEGGSPSLKHWHWYCFELYVDVHI